MSQKESMPDFESMSHFNLVETCKDNFNYMKIYHQMYEEQRQLLHEFADLVANKLTLSSEKKKGVYARHNSEEDLIDLINPYYEKLENFYNLEEKIFKIFEDEAKEVEAFTKHIKGQK
jgi:hypothetical protein